MGRDVSDRQEALQNLTGNLDILNRNLSNSIDRALSEDGGRREANFVDVVGRIRDTMATRAPEGSLVPNETAAPAVAEEPAAPTPPPNLPVEPGNDNAAPAALNTPEALEAAAPDAASSPAYTPDDSANPEFAIPSVFEGGAAEQAVAASTEQDYDEMSIAAQIASSSQADYAQSIDIMSEEAVEVVQEVQAEQAAHAPEELTEAGVTPAEI
jgi:hypothetical protein